MDILGIEIRTDALAVVHLKGSFLTHKAQSYELFGGETIEARVAGLKSYIASHAIKSPRIAIVLPRGSAISSIVGIPAPDTSAINGIMKYELEKHMPFKPEEAYWGFDSVTTKKEKEFSVLFAAVRSNTVNTIIEEFLGAGLELDHIGFWQGSVGNALFRCKDFAQGSMVAVACMKASEITLDVFYDSVPVYSKSSGRLRDDDRAGALKRELKAFLRSKDSSSRSRSVDMCAVIFEHAVEERVLNGLSKDLGLPVVPWRPLGLQMPSASAAALGAALTAAGKGRVNIDLLPSAAHKRVLPGYMQTLALSIVIAVLLLLTGAAYIIKDRVALNRLDSAVAQARAGKEKVQAVAESLKAASERVRALDRIKGRNSPGPLEVMKELTVMLPGGTWLTDFEYNGDLFFIEGFSETASAQLLKMERSGFMKDAEFIGPITRGQGGREHFRIKFKVMDYNDSKVARQVAK